MNEPPLEDRRSWDETTPDEIRDARIQALEEAVEHLKMCVEVAFRWGKTGRGSADILDEEWSK